jgi:hypothetical protein
MLKKLVYSFGFATIFLFSNVVEIVRSTGTTVFHSQLAARSQWIALLLDAMLLTALAMIVWTAGSGRRNWPRVRMALALVLPPLALAGNRLLIANLWFRFLRSSHVQVLERTAVGSLTLPIPYWLLALITAAWVLVVLWMSSHSDLTRRVLFSVAKVGLLSGAVLGLNMTLNLCRAIARRSGDDNLAPLFARDAQAQAEHPRLVWVVMDELSYRQAFEHRVPDLQMPNFDAFRAQSVLYTHVQPVAYWTELAITSMLTGEALDDDRASYTGIFRVRDANEETWHLWDPQATLFGDAEKSGWNVAVAGWWNPYCTLFRGMLQSCFWSDASPYSPTRPWFGVAQNMEIAFVNPLRVRSQPPQLRMRMNENYLLEARGLDAIADDRMDFVFVHLPVPHYPFVYDRHTGRDDPSNGHSYQDGLALADKMLGAVITVAEKSPRWKNTTLIVDGDHSWRTNMWVTEAGWTAEDEATSEGKFDDRPVLMVHIPGQSSPETVDQPTPLLHVHDIVDSVLKTGKPALP